MYPRPYNFFGILGLEPRLSEVAGCNLEDLDINNSLIRVIRKGNKEHSLCIILRSGIKWYNGIYKNKGDRVPTRKSDTFLFLPAKVGRKGKSRSYIQRSIEKLVEKYAKSFGKLSLSVNTLRHFFATRYDVGHSSIQTYTMGPIVKFETRQTLG